jgi:hypothetical protein
MVGTKMYEDSYLDMLLDKAATYPKRSGIDIVAKESGVAASTLRNRRMERGEAPSNRTETPRVEVKSKRSTVLVIPDLHCPFEHPDALDFLKAVKAKFHPTEIVCLGDEIDAHAYSKWPKDPDGMGPGQELKAAIEALIPFYVEFPDVKVCVSNHTIRPQKMMKAIGLPKAFFPAYSTMLNSPDGWTWHEHIIIDNVRYMHGDQAKQGQWGCYQNSEVYHQSCVVGHWHSRAGVVYSSNMFNLNAGCLINEKSYVFDYARHSHKRPNLGCGLVIDGTQAHFIPMMVDGDNRWTGTL